jgi:tRNA(fMet)-specific endonuclease VapC
MYLLDTNICIDFVDGRNETARKRILESHPLGLHLSAITAAELLVGPKSSLDHGGDKVRIEQFLTVLTVHPFDQDAAEMYAQIVRAVGVRRRSFDRLIAAHAQALRMTLVTNNEADFIDVPGLKVENWTA